MASDRPVRVAQGDNAGGILLLGLGAAALLLPRLLGKEEEPPGNGAPPAGVADTGAEISSINVSQRRRSGVRRLSARQVAKNIGDPASVTVNYRYKGPSTTLEFEFELQTVSTSGILTRAPVGSKLVGAQASSEFVNRSTTHNFTIPFVPTSSSYPGPWAMQVTISAGGQQLAQSVLSGAYAIG